ncbi:hypothetical protein [Nocardia salmonicida]|uniref:hypothetical protein n=1 Tax=Nocardia salmonicida TaxID=53431 RepID=UPI0007A5281D|nr:hypothetical protein [Nocardia salmonicida]
MSNEPSVEDEITREAARFGRTALAVVQAYQRTHPGKRLPRSVQREAHRAFRSEMKAQQARVKAERGQVQLDITEQIKMHAGRSISTRRNPASTPQQWAEQQWQLDQRRMQLELAIQTAPHLSREERGQAVTALVASHYADNPKVKQPPVFGGRLAGVKALRARLADRLSQAKLSLAEQLDRERGRGELRMPATTVQLPVHPYWQRSSGDLDAQSHRIEQQQRRLAEQAQREMRVIAERDQLRIERNQLRNQVDSMGEQLGEAAQQNRGLAEDLAQRGQELTAAHEQIGEVRGERDEAVRKVIAMTPPADRLGSPERLAAEAKSMTPGPSTKARQTPTRVRHTPAPAAPEIDHVDYESMSPEELKKLLHSKLATQAKSLDALDEQMKSMNVPEELREQVRAGFEVEIPDELKVETTPEAPASPKRTTSRTRKSPAAPEAKELVGAVASAATGGRNGGRRAAASRVNGSGKAAPEVPLPPEPPTGFEPPDIDDMFDR